MAIAAEPVLLCRNQTVDVNLLKGHSSPEARLVSGGRSPRI